MRALIDSFRAATKRPRIDDTAAFRTLYQHVPSNHTGDITPSVQNGTRKTRRLTPKRLCEIAENNGVELAEHPVELHAYALLIVLRAGFAGQEVRAAEVERIYLESCAENWWKPLRWVHKNGVAHHFRLLNGHAKTYRDFETGDGNRHRLSVYPISAPTPVPARPRSRKLRDLTRDSASVRRAVAA